MNPTDGGTEELSDVFGGATRSAASTSRSARRPSSSAIRSSSRPTSPIIPVIRTPTRSARVDSAAPAPRYPSCGQLNGAHSHRPLGPACMGEQIRFVDGNSPAGEARTTSWMRPLLLTDEARRLTEAIRPAGDPSLPDTKLLFPHRNVDSPARRTSLAGLRHPSAHRTSVPRRKSREPAGPAGAQVPVCAGPGQS